MPDAEAQASASGALPWICPVALAGIAAIAFLPTLGNGFVGWDDESNFLRNPHFRGLGWHQFLWAWTTDRLGVYQPLGWLLSEAEYAAWQLRPLGYHLTSLAFHAANAVVLYILTLAVLGRGESESVRAGRGRRVVASGLAASLFAVHPLRVEPVAWASSQSYLPCACFAMLAVLAYLHAIPEGKPPRRAWLFGSWLLCAAALLCKAAAVSLPAVLLILDVYPLRRLDPGRRLGPQARPVWREKLPFAILSLVFMAIAIVAKDRYHSLTPLAHYGPSARVAQSCYGACFYLVKTIWPTNLSAYYPLPDRVEWSDPRFALSLLGVVGVSAGVFLLRRRWPGMLSAWLSYLVILLPNLGLVRIGYQITADRYSYLACLGLVVLLASGLCRLLAMPGRPCVLAFALGLVVLLSAMSWRQCQTWQTSEALWSHAWRHGGHDNLVVNNNLGVALAERGDLAGAIRHYSKALSLHPDFSEAHNNLGLALMRQGKPGEAIDHFRAALDGGSDSARAHANLGRALARLGRLGQAVAHSTEAIRLDPEDARAHNSLGTALARQGKIERAIGAFTEAVRLDPGSAEAHGNLATALAERGRFVQAIPLYLEAQRLNPDGVEARIGLGTVFVREGRFVEAHAQFSEALRLSPSSARAHTGLGVVLAHQGKLEQAAMQYSEALRIDPNFAEAHNHLATVLAEQGLLQQGIDHDRHALQINPDHPRARGGPARTLREQDQDRPPP